MNRRSWRAPVTALATTAAVAMGAGAAQAAVKAPAKPLTPKQVKAATDPCPPDDLIHCYTPQDITAAYGVDAVHAQGDEGQGQTIVLVDSYGSPTAAHDLQVFHDTFYPNRPDPDFDQVHPQGYSPRQECNGNGTQHAGPCAAAGWAEEASLDVQWAYAIAPRAHIVLLGVPPAETLGVQGMPNLFNAISDAVDRYPSGTVFSMSFGFPEQDFSGSSARAQIARFDAVFKKGLAKHDTFFASSGDDGTTGTAKQQHESRSFSEPTVGYPASSPYVTAVGGTQLQYRWTWNPQSDVPFTADGDANPAYFASTPGGNTNVVWNESWLPAATGGGSSTLYPRPSWQADVPVTTIDGAPANARGVPDVSWNAAVNGGVLVYFSFFPKNIPPGFYPIGGTSAASPQVTALVALANERRSDAGEGPIGYLNPVLYGNHGAGVTDVAPVHEGAPGVISGDLVNNRLFDYNGDGEPVTPGPVPGWPTLAGWDETTGFGTPDAPAFVTALTAAP
jgi:subtilase family serine protease